MGDRTRGFKARVPHWQRGGPDITVKVYKLVKFREKVTALVGVRSPENQKRSREQLQKLLKSFESRKKEK